MNIKKTAVALILMGVIAVTTYAQKYEDEKYFDVMTSNDGKGVMIFKYNGDKLEIIIPPRIQNLPVTGIITFGLTGYAVNLISVTIPESVNDINTEAFAACTSLTAINVASGNNSYSSQDGVVYDKNKKTLIRYPRGKTASSFSIPNSVTAIGDAAFNSCDKLTSVTIPNSVSSIGERVFFACTNLTSITIPSSVTSIGYNAFGYNITSITFQGVIAPDKLGKRENNNSFISPFDGDLRDKYLMGGKGTYTKPNSKSETWTKQ
jgi:hypothetical protein